MDSGNSCKTPLQGKLLKRAGVFDEESGEKISIFGQVSSYEGDNANIKLTDGRRAWRGTLCEKSSDSSRIQLAGTETLVQLIVKYLSSEEKDVNLHLEAIDRSNNKLRIKKKLDHGAVEIAHIQLNRVEKDAPEIASILDTVFDQAIAISLKHKELLGAHEELKLAYDEAQRFVEEKAVTIQKVKGELSLHFLQILNSKKEIISSLKRQLESLQEQVEDLKYEDDSEESQQSREDECDLDDDNDSMKRKLDDFKVSPNEENLTKKSKVKVTSSDNEASEEEDMFDSF
mmetsp:Transcript_31028/g.38326  ORF Transcript_31028/g.38326 Transcript_31028/m.38326 type:complete len:287 (+) Transcript_31028:115-975(+)